MTNNVVASSLTAIYNSLGDVMGVPGFGSDDWPDWVLPVSVAFLGVSVLFIAFKWILRFAKRVK